MSVEALRAQTLKGLLAAGIPQPDAGIITDVALHGVENAMSALLRTTNVLEGPNWGNAHGIALQLLAEISRKSWEDLSARTQAAGMASGSFEVDTRQ